MAVTTQPVQYTPLKGRASAGLAKAGGRVYLGPDHLLVVEQGAVIQRLYRFYYRDIEAISCTRTRGWIYAALGMGTLAAVLFLAGYAVASTPYMEPIPGILMTAAVVVAVIAGIFLAQGPTCVTRVYTRASTARIRGLGRWRNARSAIEVIRERVAEAQGALTPEEVAEAVALRSGPDVPASLTVSKSDTVRSWSGRPKQPFVHYGVTMAAMALLLLYGLSCLLNMLDYNPLAIVVGQVVLAATVAAVVYALAKQQNTTVPNEVRVLTWVAFTELLAPYALSAVLAQFEAQMSGFFAPAGTEVYSSSFVVTQYLYAVIGVVTFVTGGVGLVLVQRQRPARSADAES